MQIKDHVLWKKEEERGVFIAMYLQKQGHLI